MKRKNKILKMVSAAIFLAIACALPELTMRIPEIGSMLCPMHIPILLCGFICGWKWGCGVGFVAPLLRSLMTGGVAPVFFPMALCMAFELATYGAISGFMHRLLPRKKPYAYCSLLTAMIAGRLIWGMAMFICLGIGGTDFTFFAFIAGAFINAIPGIIIQIVLVPITVILLDNSKILSLRD